MDFALADKNDISAVRSLWDICFGDSAEYTDIFFSTIYKPERTVLAKDGSEIIGSLQFVPHTICNNNRKFSAMYICGVDVLPAHRGKGVATKLMTFTENLLREKGIEALFLVPVSTRIYSGMGYKPLSYLSTISGPMSALSAFTGYSESFSHSASPLNSYHLFSGQFPLYLERKEETFSEEIFPLSNAKCYVSGDKSSYILFTLKDNSFQGLECGYKDAKALKKLLGFIFKNFGNLEKFSICVPADGTVRKVLCETNVKENRYLHAMVKSLSSSKLTERMENYINMIGWF